MAYTDWLINKGHNVVNVDSNPALERILYNRYLDDLEESENN